MTAWLPLLCLPPPECLQKVCVHVNVLARDPPRPLLCETLFAAWVLWVWSLSTILLVHTCSLRALSVPEWLFRYLSTAICRFSKTSITRQPALGNQLPNSRLFAALCPMHGWHPLKFTGFLSNEAFCIGTTFQGSIGRRQYFSTSVVEWMGLGPVQVTVQ